MSRAKMIDMSNFLDEMDAERERNAAAECIDDYSTEWDEYVSEYAG